MLSRQVVWMGLMGLVAASAAPAGKVRADENQGQTAAAIEWQSDYRAAMKLAAEQKKMLFVLFQAGADDPATKRFDEHTLADAGVRSRLAKYVCLRLPVDAALSAEDGRQSKLLDHPAFAEMHGRQGMAVIDLAHPESVYFGRVVSTFPFTRGMYFLPWSTQVVLDLPPGSLTQRTMVYAVRIHPEGPQSVHGQFDGTLAVEAERHSTHQAAITVQGHHNWGNRFHQISARLPGGLHAQEVVAESWPNETLVEAAVECVHCWRQSPGHWGAVRQRHPLFAFDIKRGRNGIWYATGLFGRR